MKRFLFNIMILVIGAAVVMAVESGRYRLLSVSQSTKIILVSKIPDKTKYVLDASAAKIMLDDKAAEFSTLQSFAVVIIKFELRKSTKNGIELDGVATEIKLSSPKK